MGTSESQVRRRSVSWRHAAALLAAIVVAGLVAFALSRLGLHRLGHALITVSPG